MKFSYAFGPSWYSVVIIYSYGKKPMAKRGQKHKGSANATGGGKPMSAPPRNITMQIPQPLSVRQESTAQENQQYAEGKQSRSSSLTAAQRLNWITLGGVVASFVALVFLFFSTRAATRQAKVAQDEYESSQRPWVSIEAEATEMTVGGDGRGYAFVTYTTNNVGHSVAKNVQIRGLLVPVSEETGKECDVNQEWHTTVRTVHGGYLIFPGQTFINPFPAPVTIKSMSDGKLPDLRLIACVFYDSPLNDKPHMTRLEYWVSNQAKGVIVPGGKHPIGLSVDIAGTEAN